MMKVVNVKTRVREEGKVQWAGRDKVGKNGDKGRRERGEKG